MGEWTNSFSEIERFSHTKMEPTWMLERRKQAFNAIDSLDFMRIDRVTYEDWPFFSINWEGAVEASEPTIEVDLQADKVQIIQTDHQLLLNQAAQQLVAAGLIVLDLFEAMNVHEELLKTYLMGHSEAFAENKLTAAHTAFMNSGLLIYVPPKMVIEQPIEVVFASKGNQHLYQHVLIIGDKACEFKYLERFSSGAAPRSGNILVEVHAEAGAKIKYSAVDQLGTQTTAFVNRRGAILADASIEWAIGVANDGNVIEALDSKLLEKGAQAHVKVVGLSTGTQKQSVDTRVTNLAPNTIGHILQHGVIKDRASLTFNGIGHIVKFAKGSDAQQESRVLMLSEEARADANPILLIDENEVTAGHAASVGRVDPEEMYYLMSRGIIKEDAERLVIRGFLGPVINAIPVKNVQKEFVEIIDAKIKV